MKLTVIGLGQCGSRIADQFARLDRKAQVERRTHIAPNVFAVNTDQADLTGLRYIKKDYLHRIIIGLRQTLGHGVGKINELGAELAREDGDKMIDAMKAESGIYESHAFLLVAGTAGGTGSGAIPILAQMIKERYLSKPIYALVVLPFEHEINTEARSVFNTATCLKSIYDVVDAVFLADNQRYVRKDASLINNIDKINKSIAAPFYDLMCAGEVTKHKHVGARTIDAGDLIATIEGWTALGLGRTELPTLRFPWETRKKHFREKAIESFRGSQALDASVSDLSIGCDPKDSSKIIYAISGPPKEMNMDMVKSISEYLKEIAPNALIRGGDFPGEKHFIDVTLVLSQLSSVPKIEMFYQKALQYATDNKVQIQEVRNKIQTLTDLGKGLPSL
jgi:cell division GTPase FtsZ